MTTPDPLLLSALQELAGHDARPEAFEQVARWRMACGDAEGAARWRLWSLVPPPTPELRESLAALWRQLGEPERALALLPQQPSWEQLAAQQQQGLLAEATALQKQLLADPPLVEVARLLEIVAGWQQASCPQEALALLQLVAEFHRQRGEQVSPQIANALAHQLEQLERFREAAPWWAQSLAMDPDQVWPLMRLARHELREGHPELAAHYCLEVLQRDPQHRWAPDLQQEALQAMGALGSLAVLNSHPLPGPWERRQSRWLQPLQSLSLPPERLEGLRARGPVALVPSEAWQNETELALWGDADGLALAAMAAQLVQQPPGAPITLWLLASPEPELQRHNLRLLLSNLPTELNLQSCPVWEPERHHGIRVLLLAHRSSSPAVPQALECWQEQAAPHAWQPLPR